MRTSMRGERVVSLTSADMARGLMSLPQLERVPSDSSFKRLKPRDTSTVRTTLRAPKQEQPVSPRLRRSSTSSSEFGEEKHAGSIFGRFRGRRGSDAVAHAPVATRGGLVGSRFVDSSDEEDLVPPVRGVGRAYGDTESLPPASPTVRKRSSFSQFFSRNRRITEPPVTVTTATAPVATTTEEVGRKTGPVEAGKVDGGDESGGHRRTRSASIYSKRTGKEKRFQGLRRLFRIKE